MANRIRSAEFVGSFTDWRKAPKPDLPEYAFIGRSNVGKSSLINRLCNQPGLAKTSATPGKTQTLNFFLINQQWYFADLPGYGYAKVGKEKRQQFQTMTWNYLCNRPNLMNTFVLIDSRLEPQAIDLAFVNRLGETGIPFSLVFTKCDKIGTQAIQRNVAQFEKAMLESWEELPPRILTSAETGFGKEEMIQAIEEMNRLFNPD
ncbi:MAG: ribosome biogenesis GTP-binding protein YihA/YsxC [Bacteroidia bacterium]|nr:ribosome biogenesis GTP-binding protein YihA/YsxC [Bacteroidia bacterium]